MRQAFWWLFDMLPVLIIGIGTLGVIALADAGDRLLNRTAEASCFEMAAELPVAHTEPHIAAIWEAGCVRGYREAQRDFEEGRT